MSSESRAPPNADRRTREHRQVDDETVLLAMQDLIGRKWHLILVSHLLRAGSLGFSDLEKRIDGISAKVLSESLSDLNRAGVVDRRVRSEQPIRVDYSLTERGEALEPVVESVLVWGTNYLGCESRTGS